MVRSNHPTPCDKVTLNTPTQVKLNSQNLARLPDLIKKPTYDRSKVNVGIVHIGVGGFHRSHQAYYTDSLLEKTGDLSWGICGVGIREADRKMANVLRGQDHLYTLIVRHPNGKVENRVIGSIINFLLGPDEPDAVIELMANPATRIVSLTITEGGYNFAPSTGQFNHEHPDVAHDLANPTTPKTVFGYLTESLRRRMTAGHPPFTVQSCDNIQHNGDVARKMLLAFAERRDPQLAAWIAERVDFPNAMVDRITPVTGVAEIEYLKTEVGVLDDWPVTCEPFLQWVVEDKFSSGRPAWESVGAQFVPDVTPYETMKLRLLNAGHSVLGILGSIHGHQTIDGCIKDSLFANYLRQFMDAEVTPVLPQVEGIDLSDYKDTLIERFGNANIKDNLARICLESSAKLPVFLVPTIRENLASGGKVELAALVIAAWCYYSDKRKSKDGTDLEVVDAMQDELQQTASQTPTDGLAFLRLTEVFDDLAKSERFTQIYIRWVKEIYDNPDVTTHMRTLMHQGN